MESKNNEKILHWNETKGRLKRKCSLRKTKFKKLMRVRDMLKDLQIEKSWRKLLIYCRKGKQHPF